MNKPLDIRYINPFLQSSKNIFQTIGQVDLEVGKPSVTSLEFGINTLLIELGIIGAMKGQVIFAMTLETAKEIAGMMMMSGPVPELDEMAYSALGELGNFILGNTATIFFNQDIQIDITPPITMLGDKLVLRTEQTPFKVPLLRDGKDFIQMVICITDE